MKVVCVTPAELWMNPRVIKESRAILENQIDVEIVCGSFNEQGTAPRHPKIPEMLEISYVHFGPKQKNRQRYLHQAARRVLSRRLIGLGFRSMRLVELGHVDAVPLLAAQTCRISADLYIAHYIAALPAVARAAARHGTAYAFDAEDFHLGELPDAPEHALDKDVIRAIEARYLPGAAYVSAASPMIAEAYAENYGIALPTVILNVFSKENAPACPTRQGSTHPGPSLYWFSQTIGPGRGLETALEAIARAESRPHFYLRGKPATGYESRLRDLAEQAGAADRLHILAPAPPDELEQLGANFDLGFIGEVDVTRNRQIALTNKLFSYILSGVPCLASDIPAHRSIAPELGEAMTLFPLGDAKELAALLDRFLQDSDRLAAARKHAWDLGQKRFNWEVEQRKLLRTVSSVLTPGKIDAKCSRTAIQCN